jgi:DtxR family Mn-dependent transcriptional regulator
MLKQTQEDYLRTIYFLSEKLKDKSKGIHSVDIAKELNITKPTVSRLIKKLTSQGLINSEAYSKITFTKKGFKQAEKIMYKHRIIEAFLTKTLGYKDIDKIHQEAHHLEHGFSYESIKRLDKLMKYPTKTISGKTIPRRNNK